MATTQVAPLAQVTSKTASSEVVSSKTVCTLRGKAKKAEKLVSTNFDASTVDEGKGRLDLSRD